MSALRKSSEDDDEIQIQVRVEALVLRSQEMTQELQQLLQGLNGETSDDNQ